jgi:hypothetical protein
MSLLPITSKQFESIAIEVYMEKREKTRAMMRASAIGISSSWEETIMVGPH